METISFGRQVVMFANPAASWYHSNRYSASSACEHCGGVVRHEPWCVTVDPAVQYAYEVVRDAEKLSLVDRLTLHALGVAWANTHVLETSKRA
jgi:hypothetical protein